MKLQTMLILWAIALLPFFIYWVTNYRRSTRVDRKLDRKAKEYELKRQDETLKIEQRNIQFMKFRRKN